MKKIFLFLFLFPVVGFSQRINKKFKKKYPLETVFQKGYIRYYTECAPIVDVDSSVQMETNPIVYMVYRGDLYKEKEYKRKKGGDNIDAAIYKTKSNRMYFIAYTSVEQQTKLYKGDDVIRMWIKKYSDVQSECAFSDKFFKAIKDKLTESDRDIAKEIERNEQELDSIRQDSSRYHEQLRGFQEIKRSYEDSIKVLEADKEKLKQRVNDINEKTDNFRDWAREKGEVLDGSYKVTCQIETHDNTDYVNLEISNFGVGTPCNEDIQKSTRTVLRYFIEGKGKDDLKKINKKAHLIIYVFGLSDARGGDITFKKTTIDENHLRELTNPDKNKHMKFREYGQVEDFEGAKDIMDVTSNDHILKGNKANIKDEFDITKNHLNNKILGYLRAMCAFQAAKKLIEYELKDSFAIKAEFELYSIRFKPCYYKNGRFNEKKNTSSEHRSVHLRFSLDSLYKTYHEEIALLNDTIKGINNNIKDVNQDITRCNTQIKNRETVIKEYKELYRDKMDYTDGKGPIYKIIDEIIRNQP